MPLWTRRRLLQVGGIGALGLGLPEFLNARAPSASGPRRGPEKSCIFIVQYGGASHHDSWDLKPDAPADIRGPYRPIATNVPGIRIGELLPRLARLADRYCLVRSMTHPNGGHDGGMHICMTGHTAPKENTPYFGSVMAKVRPSTRNIPSYVWLQNLAGDVQPRYLGGGFLGAAYSPLRVGNDLDNPSAPNFRVSAFDPPRDIPLDRLYARQALLGRVEPESTPLLRARGADSLRRFQERAVELLTGPEARRAFDLEREPVAVRDHYGRHPLGQNLLMARRLIEAGVRLVSVTAWCGTPSGEQFRNVQTFSLPSHHAGGRMYQAGLDPGGTRLAQKAQDMSSSEIIRREHGLMHLFRRGLRQARPPAWCRDLGFLLILAGCGVAAAVGTFALDRAHQSATSPVGPPVSPEPGTPAPPLVLIDFQTGDRVRLDYSRRERPVVLMFGSFG